jgi:hypothetical protein
VLGRSCVTHLLQLCAEGVLSQTVCGKNLQLVLRVVGSASLSELLCAAARAAAGG